MNRKIILGWRDDFQSLLRVSVQGTVLLTWIGLFSQSGWFSDLTCHFRLEYLVVQILFIPGAIWWFFERRDPALPSVASLSFHRAETAIVLASAFLNAVLVGQLWLPPAQPVNSAAPASSASHSCSEKRVLKMLQLNVNSKNDKFAEVAALVRETNVDIIAMQELSERWCVEMKSRLPEYRYCLCWQRPDNFGIGLFSRLPLTKLELVTYGKAAVPTILAGLDFDGAPLTVLSTHPLPPSDLLNYDFRNDQFAALAKARSSWTKSVVLAGDLNSTSWSQHFSDLCKKSNLKDSRQGFGVQPSWPVQLFILSIPIDHVLISEDLEVKDRKVCRSVGSDHYPVYIELVRRR